MAEILIVDDERMIRAGLAQLLSGAGFAVREARDGKSALAAVAERRPDLVLLDIMMPGMDGFGVCEKLLASDRFQNPSPLERRQADHDLHPKASRRP